MIFLSKIFEKITVINLCFLLIPLPLISDPPELIQKASQLYSNERKQIQNYRVTQNILSELKSKSETTVEKRMQVGFFIAPDKFVFLIKEKWVNEKKIPVNNANEKGQKQEMNWLSAKEMDGYEFESFQKTGNLQKFYVNPIRKGRDLYKGEIWIKSDSGKIVRIIREPSILPDGFDRYRTEIFFDTILPFQEPSFTKLNAIYTNPSGEKVEARVEAIFSNYLFNFDLKNWKE